MVYLAGLAPEYPGKDLWLQNAILRRTARKMMVAIAPENLREKMKVVPGWLREEPGGFARIAKNEKHVTCRSGKRGSGGARTTPEDKDYYQTFYFVARGKPAGSIKVL